MDGVDVYDVISILFGLTSAFAHKLVTTACTVDANSNSRPSCSQQGAFTTAKLLSLRPVLWRCCVCWPRGQMRYNATQNDVGVATVVSPSNALLLLQSGLFRTFDSPGITYETRILSQSSNAVF